MCAGWSPRTTVASGFCHPFSPVTSASRRRICSVAQSFAMMLAGGAFDARPRWIVTNCSRAQSGGSQQFVPRLRPVERGNDGARFRCTAARDQLGQTVRGAGIGPDHGRGVGLAGDGRPTGIGRSRLRRGDRRVARRSVVGLRVRPPWPMRPRRTSIGSRRQRPRPRKRPVRRERRPRPTRPHSPLTVPPALVTANRAQYAALVTANLFGQYTAQIAAAEAAYADMWAQDAQAMYGYASASSTATALTPFTEPPQTTTAAGQSAQAAAVTQAAGSSGSTTAQSALSQLLAAVPKQLQSLATTGSSTAADRPFVVDPDGLQQLQHAHEPVEPQRGLQSHGHQRRKLPHRCLPSRSAGAGSAQDRRGRRWQGGRRRGRRRQGRHPGLDRRRRSNGPCSPVIGQADPIGGLSAPQTWASQRQSPARSKSRSGCPRRTWMLCRRRYDDARHVGRADGRHEPAARSVVASHRQQHPAGPGGPLQDAASALGRLADSAQQFGTQRRHGLSARNFTAGGALMLDFGALPPEINSARMYTGPGRVR